MKQLLVPSSPINVMQMSGKLAGSQTTCFEKYFSEMWYETLVYPGIGFDIEKVKNVYGAPRASYDKEVQIARDLAKSQNRSIQNRITDVMMCPETAHDSKEDFTTGSPLYKLWWGERLREGRSTPSNVELMRTAY